MKTYIKHGQVNKLAEALAKRIFDLTGHDPKVYPIPRGGVPAAYAVAQHLDMEIVDNPHHADIYLDDIIDSGRTLSRYNDKPFFALIDKRYGTRTDHSEHSHLTAEFAPDSWIVWPWEHSDEGSIEDNVVRMLQFIGEDPNRGGLLETPKRVAKAWKEWFSGYLFKPEDVLKTFSDGAKGVDEMVVVRAPVYSHCEHHIAAIFGKATVAYIPNGKIVGLSKIKRLVDVFARRLQVQERLTNQIADAIEEHLQPLGVGVLIEARHMCIESRGVNVHNCDPTITSALRGVIHSKPEARAEFLGLARGT